MNNNTTVVFFLLTLAVLVGVPGSLALPQYLTNLSAVYGDGSCGTCHVNSSGGGIRNSYGTLFENQPNHATDASKALIAIGPPPGATTTPTVTLTLIAIPTSTPVAAETPTPTPTPAAPGFGLIVSLAGLLACAFLIKRRNK